MNTRTAMGGTDDKTYCSRVDLIKDIPFYTPCNASCCNKNMDVSEFPVWWLALLFILFMLVVASTLSLLN